MTTLNFAEVDEDPNYFGLGKARKVLELRQFGLDLPPIARQPASALSLRPVDPQPPLGWPSRR
jgi:hypothetical protein